MNPYFETLIAESFEHKQAYHGKKLFVANSLHDPYDPQQEVHQSMHELSAKINDEMRKKRNSSTRHMRIMDMYPIQVFMMD
ncbi:hypothetical protein [Portibacter marinus]|uniref:hypothetical protein n=1 Tax=Portibacter marinus TaxID=2898660 RepID=UPI001F23C991|nr:hypothetical protein [Portibacter marinus]